MYIRDLLLETSGKNAWQQVRAFGEVVVLNDQSF